MTTTKIKKEQISEKQIYLREIENVSNNRFMTDSEKELKINQIRQILNKKK